MKLKKCKYCKKLFELKRTGQKYCNLTCANRYFNDNRIFSKEHRRKISASKKGKKLSKENRKNLSISLKEFRKNNKIKCSEETKYKISIARKKYLKEHPEKHPNSLCRGRKSYPQNFLFEKLKNKYKNVKLEFHFNGFWIDILLNDKIAIEVDGQYWHRNRKQNDDLRDKIISKKYIVKRFSAKQVLENVDIILNEIGQLM